MTPIILDELDVPEMWQLIIWMSERSRDWVLIGGLMVASFSAGSSFATKADVRAWLASVETDLKRGDHFDPSSGAVLFDAYAAEWMANRALRPRTRDTYDSQLRHIVAQFGRAVARVSHVRDTAVVSGG